mmetsp:Transcript_5767/g.16512  ORF Transcript_5767/g.16512 Transcript_5767/m.16512 type:complete len:91 (+) Transcript_5767:130-402(+)
MSSVALKAFRASLRGSSKVHRAFHKSAVPAGGGHGHSEGYDAYIHAEHMYNMTAMKNRKFKMAAGTIGLVGAGITVPCIAVWWSEKKRAG